MPRNGHTNQTGGNDTRAHLDQLGDGCGCTDAWIQLSKYRNDEPNQAIGGSSE